MTQKVYRLINASLSSGTGSTSKVKISSADDVENYLDLKIAVQDGLTKEITNPAANEVLTLGLDASQIDHTLLSNIGTNSHAEIDSALNLITDVNWTGDYDNGTTYAVGDGVMYNGASFRMIEFIGAAGYNPAAYPANWLQVTDYVSPNDIGLGNVDNTSDADKPISDDTQDALDALDDRIIPIEDRAEVLTVYAYENNTQVYADGQPGVKDPSALIRDGWYFKNSIASQKINWYYFDGTSQGNATLGDFKSAYAVMTFDAVSGVAAPIIAIYTFPTGTGDAIPGFAHSRIIYDGPTTPTPVVGKQYLVYAGENPPVHPELPRINLALIPGLSIGDKLPTEQIFTISFGSSSGAAVNQIQYMVETLGLFSDPVKHEMDLRIRQASQLDLTNHVTDTNNPHSVTKDQVGLGDVDNTSDADKPISDDTQDALDLKVAKAGDTMSGTLLFDIEEASPFSAIQITKSNETETTDQVFVEYNYVGFEKLQDSEIVQYGALDAYTLYLDSYENGLTTKQTSLSSSKLLINKPNADVDGPGFNIEATDGQIRLETKVGATLQPSTPSANSHATNKNYVDNTVNTTVNTAISQLDLKLKTPQVLYVNKNPLTLSYTPDGSIHEPYLTIKDALDYAALIASASNRVCIKIAPGTYNELNTIRLKGYVDLTSYVNDTVIITVAGGSRLLWSNNSPGRVFISNISISNGVEVLNDNPAGTSGCVLDLDNVDTGTVIFNGRGGGRDFIQLRNDTRLSGSCTINSAATTIFDSTILGNLNLTDVGCVAPDSFGSAITATLRSNYQLNVNITSTNFDVYVDAWGNNNVSTLTMTSNSAVPSTFNSDASSYPNTITLSGSPAPVVARTTQARSVSVNPINGITSTDVQSALEELQSEIVSIDLSVASEPTGYLDASQTTISFTDSSPDRTFSISPVSGSFVFYANGERFTKTTTQSVQIPDQEGNHYIYFDVDGVLKSTQVFDESIILTKAFTSIIYWDADNSKHVYFANERHGLIMDGQTHIHFHTVFGAQYISGLALENFTIGDGSSNTHCQYTSDEGVIRDEDLRIEIGPESQIPTLYRLGASGNWRRKEVDSYPFIYSGTAGYVGSNGRIPFNEYTGGSWQLTEVVNNGFVLIHYFATNDTEYPVIAIQGQASYGTIVDARISANSEISQLSGLPFAEFVPIGSVILQSSDSFTNDVKARVRLTDTGDDYVDFRGSQILIAAATANNHGLLSGLSSDDHLQYHTDGRADTWLATKDTDDLAQGTTNLYLKINTLSAAGSISPTNDDLVIYSAADSAHRKIKLNQLTSVVGSAGDIAETSASFLNNISTPTNVVGLAFATAVVSSFEAQVVVSRGTKKEVFTLLGVQIDGDFSMSVESVGVDTGIDFTISDLGQVKYTSTNAIDGGTIKFRAITLTV